MAGIDLSFTITERNDNLVLTLTDTTGTYNNPDNTDGWGDPNPVAGFAFSDIVVSSDVVGPNQFHLLLSLTYTDSDSTETTYDDINLRDHNGSDFTAATDFVFEFDCADFVVSASGDALGTATDQFPDGLYEFTYKLVDNSNHSSVTDTETVSTLIDGQVRNAVYELLRTIPSTYECKDCTTKEVLDAIFSRAWLDSMSSSAYVSKTEELLNELYVLERLVTDGSTYTWQ